MSANVEKFLDLEARKQVTADDIVEHNKEGISARAMDLLQIPEQRNSSIWGLYGVADQAVTVADYQAVSVIDRDMPWVTELGAMIAAAYTQAMFDTRVIIDLLDHADHYGELIDAMSKKLSPEELRQAARQGVGKARREAARGSDADT